MAQCPGKIGAGTFFDIFKDTCDFDASDWRNMFSEAAAGAQGAPADSDKSFLCFCADGGVNGDNCWMMVFASNHFAVKFDVLCVDRACERAINVGYSALGKARCLSSVRSCRRQSAVCLYTGKRGDFLSGFDKNGAFGCKK